VEEVKTLKSLELNSNVKKEIIIYDTIIENLKQNFQDISFSSEDKNLIVLGYPEKLVQLLNGIWKITEDFGTVDHNKTLNFKTYTKDSNVILKLEIPTTHIDTNFFNYSNDFNSYAGVNHSLRVRLSILKSILEEHNAQLAYDIKNEYLIFRIEFSTKDAKY
jgi:hypothetical protein